MIKLIHIFVIDTKKKKETMLKMTLCLLIDGTGKGRNASGYLASKVIVYLPLGPLPAVSSSSAC